MCYGTGGQYLGMAAFQRRGLRRVRLGGDIDGEAAGHCSASMLYESREHYQCRQVRLRLCMCLHAA